MSSRALPARGGERGSSVAADCARKPRSDDRLELQEKTRRAALRRKPPSSSFGSGKGDVTLASPQHSQPSFLALVIGAQREVVVPRSSDSADFCRGLTGPRSQRRNLLNPLKCASCGEDFTSVRLFDAHRATMPTPPRGDAACLSPVRHRAIA